jgi:1-acyl-sn-glycerol-3-phosphate acyltransferase
VKLLKEVREKRGKKVVIFPEGTRSITGEIQEFEAGAKMVAEKLALKVQAVVIKDLAQFYNEGKKHSKLGNVHIEVLPPAVIKEGWFDESRMQMIKVQKEI